MLFKHLFYYVGKFSELSGITKLSFLDSCDCEAVCACSKAILFDKFWKHRFRGDY